MAPFTFTARIRNRIHKSTNLTRFVISSLWLCLHLEPCSCCQVAVVNNGIASTGYSTFNIHGAHVHPRFCYNQLNATTNLANMAFWGLGWDGTDFNIILGGIFGACLGSRISKRLSQAYSGYIKETLSPRAALQTHVTLHTCRDGGFLWRVTSTDQKFWKFQANGWLPVGPLIGSWGSNVWPVLVKEKCWQTDDQPFKCLD